MDYDDEEREYELMEGCANTTRWLAGILLLSLVLATVATCAARHF